MIGEILIDKRVFLDWLLILEGLAQRQQPFFFFAYLGNKVVRIWVVDAAMNGLDIGIVMI